MLRVSNLKVDVIKNNHRDVLVKKLGIKDSDLISYKIHKKSIDSRNKSQVFYVYELDIELKNEDKYLKSKKVDIMLVEPLATFLSPHFQFQNILITIILCGGIIGVGNGLIYKAGFTTGGGDLIMKMISKFQRLTEGTSQLIENVIIVLLGGLVLGIPSVIYSIILNVVCANITDKILIGISNSKMFFIYSKKTAKIKKYVLDDLESGMTIIHTEGGFKLTPRKMLMVVVPTREYYAFREMILAIDPDAFFVITDCYEVSGGVKKEKNTFLPI